MNTSIIAAAQSISKRGDVQKNLEGHYRLIELALSNHAQIIVFPELSLTGYEPDLAKSLAFSKNDNRLTTLRKLSVQKNIVIVAGAPVQLESGLHIGAFIISPDASIQIYTKRYLHSSEENYFSPCFLNPIIKIGEETAALAICADTSNPQHPLDAVSSGASIYLAGVLFSDKCYPTDAEQLRGYYMQYHLTVALANHGGDSGEYHSAGRSAIWSPSGEILAEMSGTGEGIVLAVKEKDRWRGRTIKK